MSKSIDAKDLYFHIWRQGPYIIFYNGKCEGYNSELVSQMNKMSFLNPKLHVFEIDWKNQKDIHPSLEICVMNTVYLHYKGKEEYKEFCPNEEKINKLFKKAVDLYNLNIETKAKNTGSICLENNKSKQTIKDKHLLNRRLTLIKYRKKSILRKIIEFHEDKIENHLEIRNNSDSIKKTNRVPKIEKKTKKLLLPSINNLEMKSKIIPSKQAWFQNVQVTDLPSDLLQSNLILNPPNHFSR